MLTGKLCMNLGLVKMNWLMCHQAISHAQVLGFHRPQRITPDETCSQMAIDKKNGVALRTRRIHELTAWSTVCSELGNSFFYQSRLTGGFEFLSALNGSIVSSNH